MCVCVLSTLRNDRCRLFLCSSNGTSRNWRQLFKLLGLVSTVENGSFCIAIRANALLCFRPSYIPNRNRKVVGAGRGPLVDAALKAGVTADRKLRVFAVEKNANAVITLRNRAIMDKWTNVTIVAKDMRDWVRDGMDEGWRMRAEISLPAESTSCPRFLCSTREKQINAVTGCFLVWLVLGTALLAV